MAAGIVFVISNDRHHPAMVEPVIRRLLERGHAGCRVVSLCELRGMTSPTDTFRRIGVDCRRVLPFHLRRGAVARSVSASKSAPGRHRRLQSLVWRLATGPRLAALLRPAPAVVVLPNDAAYPYDRLAMSLRGRKTPFVLLQEGIRFELPGVPRSRAYGSGGAAAVAAWGDSSVEYFQSAGVEPHRIRVTGSPRFDEIETPRQKHGANKRPSRSGTKKLVLVTNPIDEQGFCTSDDKLALVRRFADEITPLVEDRTLSFEIKLHASESAAEYRKALADSAIGSRLSISENKALFPLLESSDAAVIMASTVGVEALLCGLPLGVLELPGTGFVFDYVRDGAALGLTWSRPLAEQVRALLDYHSPQADRFLTRHLHRSPDRPASEDVAQLIIEVADLGAG